MILRDKTQLQRLEFRRTGSAKTWLPGLTEIHRRLLKHVSCIAEFHLAFPSGGRAKGDGPTLRVVVMTAPAYSTVPEGALSEERQRAGWAAFEAELDRDHKQALIELDALPN